MSLPLRVLLVDDEPLARLRLRQLLQGLSEPPTHVLGEAADAASALAQAAALQPELVLLDIHMPGTAGMRDGLQLAHALQAQPGLHPAPAVVFVTAHAEHALQAFDAAAVDYLTKPVRPERLREALLRVWQHRRAPALHAPAEEGALLVHDRGRLLRVPVTEVLYLKAEAKYVTLRTREHSHVLDESLTELEPRLGTAFVRIHRNALVRATALRELRRQGGEEADAWAVRVAGVDEWLAVSRRQVGVVKEVLG